MTGNNEEERLKRRQQYFPEATSDAKYTCFSTRPARFTLEKDVVLPSFSRVQIDEALIKIQHHKTIYLDWGFEAVDPIGKGVILNFYGKPGTGKTLAAEALAGTLGRPYIAVGIAELESKFMGETSKNIQAVFQTAKEHDAILFFDEADTVLGKRLSSVTQGVDNEVNAMRSTMLIELEQCEGIVIFATNFAENYDKAFESRITHHVNFLLPDFEGRRAIWQKMLTPGIPMDANRGELIEAVTEMSEGLSGRDIRTCMRLGLPKLVIARSLRPDAGLEVGHLAEAIEQVRQAKREIGQEFAERKMERSELNLHRRLLGLEAKGDE